MDDYGEDINPAGNKSFVGRRTKPTSDLWYGQLVAIRGNAVDVRWSGNDHPVTIPSYHGGDVISGNSNLEVGNYFYAHVTCTKTPEHTVLSEIKKVALDTMMEQTGPEKRKKFHDLLMQGEPDRNNPRSPR